MKASLCTAVFLALIGSSAAVFVIENEEQFLGAKQSKSPAQSKVPRRLENLQKSTRAPARRSLQKIGTPEQQQLYDEASAWADLEPNIYQVMQETPSNREYRYRAGPERFWAPPNAPMTETLPGPFLPIYEGVPGQPINGRRLVNNEAFSNPNPTVMFKTARRNSDVVDPPIGYINRDPTQNFYPPVNGFDPRFPVTPQQPGNLVDPLSPQVNNINGPFHPIEAKEIGSYFPFVNTEASPTLPPSQLGEPVYLFDPAANETTVFDPLSNTVRPFNADTDPTDLVPSIPLPAAALDSQTPLTKSMSKTAAAPSYLWLLAKQQNSPLTKSTANKGQSLGANVLLAPPAAPSRKSRASKPANTLTMPPKSVSGPQIMIDATKPIAMTNRAANRASRRSRTARTSRRSRKGVTFAPGTHEKPASAQATSPQQQAIANTWTPPSPNPAELQQWQAPAIQVPQWTPPAVNQCAEPNQWSPNGAAQETPSVKANDSKPLTRTVQSTASSSSTATRPRQSASVSVSVSVSAKTDKRYKGFGQSQQQDSSAPSRAFPKAAITALAVALVALQALLF
jgi:hypothetical protein